MARQPISLTINDVSNFARALRAQIPEEASGHQTWLNRVAKAAGYRNFQHLSAMRREAERPADTAKVTRAMRNFDADGQFAHWPAKTSVQELCLWAVWARLPRGVEWQERAFSELINQITSLKDAAQIRRSLTEHGLVRRESDGSSYRRVERQPTPEAKALITALREKTGA